MSDPASRGDKGGKGGSGKTASGPRRGGKQGTRQQSESNKNDKAFGNSDNTKQVSSGGGKQRGRGGISARRSSRGSTGSGTAAATTGNANGDNVATKWSNRGHQYESSRDKLNKRPAARTATNFTGSNQGPGNLSASEMLAFLEDGVRQVSNSPETREAFIKKLAKDAGLPTVRQIAETEFSNAYSVTRPSFKPHCTLFLQLITDDSVLTSSVLETSVDTLYNYIYGFDGKRGIPFLQRISTCLVQFSKSNDSDFSEALVATTKALLAMLTRNQGSTIKAEFGDIVDQLDLCSRNINNKFSRDLRLVEENLAKIKDFLSFGNAIPSFRVDALALDVPRNSKNQRAKDHEAQSKIDFPGELSEVGPRHDNDHANISDISTLPTSSEVLNTRPDFLPIRENDGSPGKHHQTGILQLFDSQYRLLREDTSGLVRDSLRLILHNWDQLASYDVPWKDKRRLLRNHSPTPVRMYTGAEVRSMTSDKKWGIEMVVEFDQVQRLRRWHPGKREHWWRTSRELRENGPVLALVRQREEGDTELLFCMVSKREISAAGARDNNQVLEADGVEGRRMIHGLSDDAERASITLRMTGPARDTDTLLRLASGYGAESPLILFEFPAVLFRSYDGVLRCLQSIHNNPSSMPFSTWLVPRPKTQSQPDNELTEGPTEAHKLNIPPPAYLTDGVTLNLDCLAKAGDIEANFTIPKFSLSQDPGILATQLADRTTLDPGQAVALVSALRHEIALIQGPPGTGKSFVGIQLARCLLENRDLLNLGPIVCICYTNHALDQFLNELMDCGITNMIRIGARSMTPRLEALSLDNVKKANPLPRTKHIGREVKACQAALAILESQIKDICSQTSNIEHMVLKYVEKRDPERIRILFSTEPDRNGSIQNKVGKLQEWLAGNGPGRLDSSFEERTIDELLMTTLSTMTHAERQFLYQYWQTCAITDLRVLLKGVMEAFIRTKHTHTTYFNQSNLQLLEKAHVLGITTTQFANNSDMLRGLKAKVIICEEAGEVLESHVLTALLPSVQHLVLIGDHLQLRPKISNLSLAKERGHDGARYNLDESLFERLAGSRLTADGVVAGDAQDGVEVTDGFPVAQLDHQRRMHPSVSNLIRETLYPKLRDHPRTSEYPEVVGLKDRLFWLDHRNYEDATDESEPMQSKTNTWEAEMVTALVRHLCRQGAYKPGEIAVLTPYLGQLRILTDMLAEVAELVINEKDLEDLYDSDKEAEAIAGTSGGRHKNKKRQLKVEKGRLLDRIRMATIDNFQGEEATVIIISLVRSNQRKICGFLKSPNRINVLLSRAKHGMYIVGNAETAIGDPRTNSHVPMWEKVIGMLEQNSNIGDRLALHCARHPDNKVFVKSPDDFAIRAPEGGCDAKCKLRLQCGHSCSFKCHPQALHDMVMCQEPCTRMKECGHACPKKCSEPCGECREMVYGVQLPCGHTAAMVECSKMSNLEILKCQERVRREFPICGHAVMLPCWQDISTARCMKICDDLLPCGHNCRRLCSFCKRTDISGEDVVQHGTCITPCGRGYTTCSHACSRPCHPETPCPPCERNCEVRCKHSICPKKCHEPCPPCAEVCGWACDHEKERCQLPCAVPCNIKPCNERCRRKLETCGHVCPGVCGERCPSSAFCKECATPEAEILNRTVDFISFDSYRDVDPSEDPLVFLECGHFFTISTLDGIMGLEESYEPKKRIASGGTAVKACPECRLSIRNISRYNRSIKAALLDEATKRFVAQAAARSAELITQIQERESNIEKERAAFVKEWSGDKSNTVNTKLEVEARKYPENGISLLRAIKEYKNFVSKEEQPFGRVNEMLASAITKQGQTISENASKLDDSMIQTGFQLRAECMRFRAQWPILWDLDTIAGNSSVDSRMRKILREKISAILKRELKGCRTLLKSAEEAKLRQYHVEATIYHALFTILNITNNKEQGKTVPDENDLREQERKSLEECEGMVSQHPGTMAHLSEDLDKAKRLLTGGTFYTLVTTEERRNVYRAMASQFSGTGHWYYCQNRHPFTVGECGMPMELARCPECGAPVGGHDHTSVGGVERADDLEAEYARG